MLRPAHGTRQRANALTLVSMAATVLAACADEPSTAPGPLGRSGLIRAARAANVPTYEITDLGTLGGSFSVALGVNGAGEVGGSANTPEEVAHAVLWTAGQMTDLGSLGGNILAIGPNDRDQLVGMAELLQPDPDGEDLCGFGTHRICRAVVWQRGTWTELPMPPLGGRNSMAGNLDDRGQAVGLAETGVRDPSCAFATPFQVHRFVPVVWGPKLDAVQVLPLLARDEVGVAFGINDHDQVVGTTGACATTSVVGSGVLLGPHAVLWDHGVAIPLDPPGSTNTISTAYSVNDRGEVVGVSGGTVLHAFLWTRRTGMQSLGTVDGDAGSIANWINDRGQVVGASCPETPLCEPGPEVPARAALWQDGVAMDLNALVVGESPMYLLNALAMNDRGQIVGLGLTNDFQVHAFLATPHVARSHEHAR